MNLSHKFSSAAYAYGNLYLKKSSPVIVYAPGRVGSMGLIKNLRESDQFSFKVEFFSGPSYGTTRFCKKHILQKNKSARIITLVRDPVDIMASYFFSKTIKGWIPEALTAHKQQNIPLLQDIFIKQCLLTHRLDTHLYWYENDFAANLNLDVFEHRFDTEKKYDTIKHNRFPTLIMRTDLPDTEKELAIEGFLRKKITITRENVRIEKKGNDGYIEFKNTLCIPKSILEKIYTSPYATHFFSPSEIANLIAKWS